MPARENHYTLLELDVTASTSQIRLAVSRLARKADELAYTSPEEAHALWRRIRQIRADLLSGLKAREAYDLAVLSELKASRRPDPAYVPIVFPPPLPPDVRTEIEEWHVSDPVMRWAPLAGVAAVLVALVLLLLPLGVGTRRQSAVQSTALLLSASGPRAGAGFVSGEKVTLSWSGVGGARLYRLQIAATPADPSDQVVFRRPLRTVMTAETFYRLQVVGAQMYYWRVQALVGGHWTRFTHSRHFLVDRPTIEPPIALAAASVSRVKEQQVRLCWSRVAGAAGYRVQILGLESVTAHSSCAWLRLYPGAYRWTVAALARGARVYTGKPSRPQVLVVSAPQAVRLVAVRLPATTTATATPLPQRTSLTRTHRMAERRTVTEAAAGTGSGPHGKRPEGRMRKHRRASRGRPATTTSLSSARVVAVRVSTSRSSASPVVRHPTRTARSAARHGAPSVRRTIPARPSAGKTGSRHGKKPHHPAPHSTSRVPPPPPPAPPAVKVAVDLPAAAAAPTAIAPPVVMAQATPVTGTYGYVAPAPASLEITAAPASGTGVHVVAAVPTPSPMRQPVTAPPTAPPAGGSHPSAGVPPAGAPLASAPPRAATGQRPGQGRGDNHADEGHNGDRGNGAGRGHTGRPLHP